MTGSSMEKCGNGTRLIEYCCQIFWSLHEVSSSKTDLENAFFGKIHERDNL